MFSANYAALLIISTLVCSVNDSIVKRQTWAKCFEKLVYLSLIFLQTLCVYSSKLLEDFMTRHLRACLLISVLLIFPLLLKFLLLLSWLIFFKAVLSRTWMKNLQRTPAPKYMLSLFFALLLSWSIKTLCEFRCLFQVFFFSQTLNNYCNLLIITITIKKSSRRYSISTPTLKRRHTLQKKIASIESDISGMSVAVSKKELQFPSIFIFFIIIEIIFQFCNNFPFSSSFLLSRAACFKHSYKI